MWGYSPARVVVLGSALALLFVCSVAPVALMLAQAFVGAGSDAPLFDAWRLDGRQRTLLLNTALLGIGAALVAVLLGTPLGFALARQRWRHRRWWRILLAVPLLLPAYVTGLGWLSLGGRTGLLSVALGFDPLGWLHGLPGAVVILGLAYYPIPMFAAEAALHGVERRLEEAALLVAGPWRTFWSIRARLAAPAIIAAVTIVFVLTIAEFAVPGLLGVRVFTTEVFTAFAALYDPSRATRLASPLLAVSVLLVIGAAVWGRSAILTTSRGPSAEDALDDPSVPSRVLATSVAVLAVALPIGMLILEAAAVRSWTNVLDGSSAAILTSVGTAAISASVATIAGAALGYAAARTWARLGATADVLLLALLAVPSTVVGVGLVALFNRAELGLDLYGTHTMLVVASLARFLPLAALSMGSAMHSIPRSQEEAAVTAGAGWFRTTTHIIGPQLARAAAATWVIVFVLAFGELGASILVVPPGTETLPIRIYTLIANALPAQVAALALLQVVATLLPLIALARLFRRVAVR
jgi:iron(III) transport system permease protein